MRVDHIESREPSGLSRDGGPQPRRPGAATSAPPTSTWSWRRTTTRLPPTSTAPIWSCPTAYPGLGAPRALGLPQRRRVRVTPDLLLELLRRVRAAGRPARPLRRRSRDPRVFIRVPLGATPGSSVAYAWSPPFPARSRRTRTSARGAGSLQAAGVQLLLVGIGCPKQELWMAAHADPSALRDVRRRRRLRRASAAGRGTRPRGCGTAGSSGSTAWRANPAACGVATCSTTRGSSCYWRRRLYAIAWVAARPLATSPTLSGPRPPSRPRSPRTDASRDPRQSRRNGRGSGLLPEPRRPLAPPQSLA